MAASLLYPAWVSKYAQVGAPDCSLQGRKTRRTWQCRVKHRVLNTNLKAGYKNSPEQYYLLPTCFMALYSKPTKCLTCFISDTEQLETSKVHTAQNLGQCQLFRTGLQSWATERLAALFPKQISCSSNYTAAKTQQLPLELFLPEGWKKKGNNPPLKLKLSQQITQLKRNTLSTIIENNL